MTGKNGVAPEENKVFQRLPTFVIPKHYTLELEPNLETFVFRGHEVIDVIVKEVTSEIQLNAADLEISKVSWQSGGEHQEPKSFNVDTKNEILSILFEPALQPSSGSLTIDFTGTLNDKLKGFYRSKYRGPNGEDRYNAVTQFEATDARRCFPCWDEPAIRATFDISLIAHKDKVALSNMPVKKTSVHPTNSNLLVHEYETTPSMSTYLIAVIVGEFDYVEERSSNGVVCRVYTAPGKKDQGRFALHVTVKVLPYYEEYFGIPYGLPKLDLIAIADFAIGAMENWGLITYRETALLVDEANTAATNRQYVALVVGHEIAHQWFGNLVALEWWTHLWLKEGYASFVEFLCVQHLFPEYDIWTQFVTEMYTRALTLDSLESSHPIEVPVGHPSEIDQIFDAISYNKGASIIRMLHNYVGVEDFRKGMNSYLTRHKYGNASTEDLWTALEEASKKPVGDVMSTWTKQRGYPLISVSSRQEGSNRIVTLTQEKYSLSLSSSAETSAYNWLIPLTFSSSQNPEAIIHEVLMDSKTLEVVIPNVEESQWIKINPGTVGFYRVKYTTDMLPQFIPAIKKKILPPLDRLGILEDLFFLVQAGHCSTVEVLQILEAYTEEDNCSVWTCINTIIDKLGSLLAYSGEGIQHSFKAYCVRLLSKITEKLGWEARKNESHLDTLLRSRVLGKMVHLGHMETIDTAKKLFSAHVKGEKILPADLRNVGYAAALVGADDAAFNSIIKLYREADIMEEKDRIGRSFRVLENPDLIQKALEFAISDDVRSQDSAFVIISIGSSKVGRDIVWEFFKKNIEVFKKRYIGGQMASRVIKQALEGFASEDKAEELETFFRENPYPGCHMAVRQSVESILINSAWLKRDEAKVQAFLKSI